MGNNIENMESRINELSSKVINIESKVSKIDRNNEFDYQKILSAIKYLYRYYDDMTKDRKIDITSTQR